MFGNKTCLTEDPMSIDDHPFGISPTGLVGLFRHGGDLMLAAATPDAYAEAQARIVEAVPENNCARRIVGPQSRLSLPVN
jgi:hypothetical protein